MGCPSASSACLQKALALSRAPESTGPDGTHIVGVHVPQALTETLEATDRALRRLGFDVTALIQSRAEAHHFPQPVDHGELPVGKASHQHVEAVGPKIHGGHHLGVVLNLERGCDLCRHDGWERKFGPVV